MNFITARDADYFTFYSSSSGGTSVQLSESFEDNLRIKFSDAAFISDAGIIDDGEQRSNSESRMY